jgi:hypothetical protein
LLPYKHPKKAKGKKDLKTKILRKNISQWGKLPHNPPNEREKPLYKPPKKIKPEKLRNYSIPCCMTFPILTSDIICFLSFNS